MTDSLKSWMISDLASRLGLNPRQIDVHERFNQYGLDSAAASHFIAALSEKCGRPLPPTLVWKYPTIDALTRFLSGNSEPVPSTAHTTAASHSEPIAVIGMSCRVPHAKNLEEYWRLLCNSIDAVSEVPAGRWSLDLLYDPDPAAPGKMNTRWGGFLERVDEFDPQFFGISPREALDMDPQQRLALELAWEALEDAAVNPAAMNGTSTGVYFGAMWSEYSRLASAASHRITSYSATGQDSSIIAARISYAMGLGGPSLTVNTACSSSLVAVHLACQALRAGDCETAIAGGVNLLLTPDSTIAMTKFGAMSPDGRCKAFDARANGYVRGEGGGAVVLKPLSRALAAGDPIYCTIPGSAVNNDGFSNGLTAPNPEAQESVLREAYRRAGIAPHRVHYVEAHGTGTMLGDPIEAGALGAVLGAGRPEGEALLIGSVKTNIGHLEAAAGIAGLIKVILSIRNRAIPASLHFQKPNPHISFESLGLQVQHSFGAWPKIDEPAVAGVSSFGFGGTNCHVVVHEMPLTDSLPQIGGSNPTKLNRKLAFVFSGNGSQWTGMGKELLAEPVFLRKLQECDRLLGMLADWSLLQVLTTDRDGRSNRVDVSQPTLFALQVSLAALWQSRGIRPDVVVGHSLGEVAAAHFAGILSLDEAVRVVFHRSRLLQRKSGLGAMALVEIPLKETELLLRGCENTLSVAACNSPSSTVVSGDPSALIKLLSMLGSRGITAQQIRVDVAYHSPQIDNLKAELRESLDGLLPHSGTIPMMSSVTGAVLNGRKADADYWVANMRQRVLFSDSIANILEEGVDLFLEISPHPLLLNSVESTFRDLGREGKTLASLRRGNESRTFRESLTELLNCAEKNIDAPAEQSPDHIFTLSAKSANVLRELARNFEEHFSSHPEQPFADICYTANTGRAPFRHRLAIACASTSQARQLLATFRTGGNAADLFVGAIPAAGSRVAFVFEEPDAHCAGVGRRLYETQAVFREAFDRCDQALRTTLGCSLASVSYPASGGDAPIPKPQYSQPILFALHYALASLWRSWGVHPVAIVGNGIGELAAACIADVLNIEDGATLSLHRGFLLASLSGLEPSSPAKAALNAFDATLAKIDFHPPSIPLFSGLHRKIVDDDVQQESYWRAQILSPASPIGGHGLAEIGANIFIETGLSAAPTGTFGAVVPDGFLRFSSLQQGRDDWDQMVESLCRLHIQGVSIDWNRFADHHARRRAHLPTYPFEREKYWPDPMPINSKTEEKISSSTWMYRLDWRECPPLGAPPKDCQIARWLVIGDANGLALKLADRLRSSGQICDLAPSYPDRRGPMDRIVYAAGTDIETPEQSLRICEDLLGVVRGIAREKSTNPAPLWLITRDACSVTGHEFAVKPAQAALWGFFRTLALERPEWLGGILDLDSRDLVENQAAMLAAVLQSGQAETEDQVAFRGGVRYSPRLLRTPEKSGLDRELSFDPGGAYLITGGLGAIGIRLAQWMATRGARHFVLAGRRPPVPKQLQAIHDIEKLGATVNAAAVDTTHREQIESVIAEFGNSRPPLRGVFHLASAWSSHRLEDMDARTFGTMFQTKAAGAWHLHELTKHIDLDWFVLFSSVASILGSQYLGHYAAANAFLNALAVQRRSQNLPGLAIHWGPWKDTPFSSPDGRRSFKEFGLSPMDSNTALDVLGRLMAAGVTEQMAADIDWTVLQPLYESKRQLPMLNEMRKAASKTPLQLGAFSSFKTGLSEKLKRMPESRLREALTELVQQHFAQVFKFRSPHMVDTGRGFFEMGMDSLTSVEFRRRLEADLECALPSTLTFTCPNVDALAAYLASEVLQSNNAIDRKSDTLLTQAAPSPTETDADGLSEDEIHASLIEELNRAGY